MTRPYVRCDDCGWEDTVSSIRHLRAWYRAACPACGCGELIDTTEVRMIEELIAMERLGWVWLDGTQPERPGIRAVVNSAADPIITFDAKATPC
jgi:hypothetical protein